MQSEDSQSIQEIPQKTLSLSDIQAKVASSGMFATGFSCRYRDSIQTPKSVTHPQAKDSLGPQRLHAVIGDRPINQHGSNFPQHVFANPNGVSHPRNINFLDYYDSVPPEIVHIRGGSLTGLTPE